MIEILTGDDHGEIGVHENLLRHLMFDCIYLAVIAAAVLSLVTVRSKKANTFILCVVNFALAALLLMLAPVFLATPLWVVKAFVPDMFTVIVVSASLFLLAGAARIILLCRNRSSRV